ncbi:hypothetical protein ACFWHW_27635 [Streptomyces pharetrae]|uniref:hypothetical protein n=1 Tax=Streptomyces pharetrae TaxID=291370 RepID=UPI003661CF0D
MTFLVGEFRTEVTRLTRSVVVLAYPSAKGAGLRVRQEPDAVVVGWVPADQLDPAGRMDAEYEGIRTALRQALLEILTQAGFSVQADRSSGEVRVRPA